MYNHREFWNSLSKRLVNNLRENSVELNRIDVATDTKVLMLQNNHNETYFVKYKVANNCWFQFEVWLRSHELTSQGINKVAILHIKHGWKHKLQMFHIEYGMLNIYYSFTGTHIRIIFQNWLTISNCWKYIFNYGMYFYHFCEYWLRNSLLCIMCMYKLNRSYTLLIEISTHYWQWI